MYEAPAAAPCVEEIEPGSADEFIEALAVAGLSSSLEQRGGAIPYTVIREVAENLIHADFAEPVVSILDDGHTIRFADQGPGIPDKDRAVLPGFTTATANEGRHPRSRVGSADRS